MSSTNKAIFTYLLVTLAVVGVIACIIFLVVLTRRVLRRRSSYAYAQAENVTFQVEGEFGAMTHRAPAVANRGGNSAITDGPTHNNSTSTQNASINRRDNYADRDAIDYCRDGNGNYWELDGGVRPASPNAERVEGVPIETRVRPRRHLPRVPIVVHHGDREVHLDFRGVDRVPQAGPPPLTLEEKQRLEDEKNRVASPEFYGRAEYEFRRASNRNTPTLHLSPYLLQELQRQYSAASASARSMTHHASDASVGSMSLRPGSPAGSARRARHYRQGINPSSFSLANGSTGSLQIFQRPNPLLTRNEADSSTSPKQPPKQRNSSFPALRNRLDDLESTSDDFEDASLHLSPFQARREQLQDFLMRQEQQAQGRLSPMSPPGHVGGFDQTSLLSISPVFIDHPGSTGASVASGNPGGFDGARVTPGSVTPLEDARLSPSLSCNATGVAGSLTLNTPIHSIRSRRATSANAGVAGPKLVTSTSHMDLSAPVLGADTARAGSGGSVHSSGRPAYSGLPAKAEYTTTHPRVSTSGSGKSGLRKLVTQPGGWNMLTPQLNQWSSGLRSPFSLPSNDPVTASDSRSSVSRKIGSASVVSPPRHGSTENNSEFA